ncbi:MAG TPA: glycoside hydrolase family 5 protein [Gemmatimonadaceae bacterium]
MRDMRRAAVRQSLLAGIILVAAGCAASHRAIGPDTGRIPDINAYPAMANDAPPGASASAAAMASAIGRGVNFGNMLEAPTEGAWGLRVTDDFIDKATAAGFTAVRLPVRWSNHASADAPYTIDPLFLAHVDSIVDKLLAKGIVVVLNMHHYRQLDGDAPDPRDVAVDPRAVDVRFVMMWEQIATHFQGKGARLLFEPYNEPHGRLTGEPWNVLAARTLGVIRRTNPTRVVVIGPTNWNAASDLALLKLPNDANLIATIHDYNPFTFTHQGAGWVTPTPPTGVTCCSGAQVAEMTQPLDVAKSWSDVKHYPVYVGEFGSYSKADSASRIVFNRAMRSAMESRGMSWTYWEFAAGFGVYDPVARAFRQALLDSLLGA